MTVFVASWADDVVTVALDEVDARAALEEKAAAHLGANRARLTLDWQPLPAGGASARVFNRYTASVVPFEVIA
ncbi:MAG: hypothetical protein KF878_09775 [Planctomycetes bacterium]|nr:hypothetical protein [Planctomycetota bacterium]